MTLLLAWFVFPLALGFVSLGCGLLLESIAGTGLWREMDPDSVESDRWFPVSRRAGAPPRRTASRVDAPEIDDSSGSGPGARRTTSRDGGSRRASDPPTPGATPVPGRPRPSRSRTG